MSCAGPLSASKSADPGYDWLFTRGIAGLVTCYGGANSHMAIRCAEYNLPAAIGCGGILFERMCRSRQGLLDCASKTLIPLQYEDLARIALIHSAGRGSRLRELTADKPKCLVELAGKPLLRWQYDALRQAGTERILVVRGYLAQRLTPAAIGLEPDAFENVENPCWAKSNMLSSCFNAATWLDEAFGRGEDNVVISYSDIVYPAEHIRALATAPEDMAITCHDERRRTLDSCASRTADVNFCQKDGLLRDIGGKPESMANIQGQYMGLMLLRPHGWERLKKICAELGDAVPRMDLTGFLQHLLSRNIRIGVVPVRGHWCEVDSQEDMRCYQQAMNA